MSQNTFCFNLGPLVASTVNATDGKYTTRTVLTVTIVDENDNAPEFAVPRYFFTVDEGPGTSGQKGYVGSVVARDRDPDSSVTYHICGGKWMLTTQGCS